MKTRYPHIPSSLTDFLSGLQYCTNPDQTAWFLCESDFAGTGESAWRWNDFETMEMEETEDQKAIVTKFWDTHIPFFFSVRTGYSFFALNVESKNSGKVAHIFMEYGVQERDYVSSTFEEFLQELIVTVKTGEGRFKADI